MDLDVKNHIKYYRYWVLRNGYKYVSLNFITITKQYTLLKELCIKIGMEEDFNRFFSLPVKTNKLFSEGYLGRLTTDWSNRKGISYEFYLKGLFNGR